MSEKDWTTKAGLRAVALRHDMGHYCGYVAVGVGHPLYGIGYSESVPLLKERMNPEQPIGKRGVIPLMCAPPLEESVAPDIYFDVHGGITFADGGDGYPAKGAGLWWFGFDCAHAGDSPLDQDLTYVVGECESLARQLAALASPTTPKAK